MLNSEEFNLWAHSYDKDIEQWSQDNGYPFAGYWELMNLIYKRYRLACWTLALARLF